MKRVLTSLLIFISALYVDAETISVDRAKKVALDFIENDAKFMKSAANQLILAYEAKSVEDDSDFYVFNCGKDDGYVIVSADDRALPVLGYSINGCFNYNTIPDNMRWWLSQYQSEIAWLRTQPATQSRRLPKLRSSVAPLLSTTWDQGFPYNLYCPTIEDSGAYYYTPSGCLATAMAQIMNYHRWPPVGRGCHEYNCNVNGSTEPTLLSADFSKSVYDWDNMLDSYNGDFTDQQGLAVARLMSDVGVALNMDYGLSGSAAKIIDVLPALRAYFDYDAGMQLVIRDNYNGDWDAMLRADLDARRPIYYFGRGDGGHAFVFDGYDDSGYFHVNWGWGGLSDDYFASTSLDPYNQGAGSSSGGFSNNQHAIIGVQPSQSPQPCLGLVKDVTPVANIMPADNIRAQATFQALGGDYEGEALMWIFDENYNVYDYVYAEINLVEGEKQTYTFESAIEGVNDGDVLYIALRNPYYSNIGYIWGNEVPFTIGKEPLLKGDVTGDGNVDIEDVNAIINIILDTNVASNYPGDANVDGIGNIDISDVNSIINIVLDTNIEDNNDENYKEICSFTNIDGKNVVLEKNVDLNDVRVNADSTVFYRSTLAIKMNSKRYVLTDNIYTINDVDLWQFPCMVVDRNNQMLRVFSSSKPDGQDYRMEGFVYQFDMNSCTTTTESVFRDSNWGWFSFFESFSTLRHFSFAGYYMANSILGDDGTWNTEYTEYMLPDAARELCSQQPTCLIWN